MLFSYFGPLGNTIFFVCSAYFLLCSSKCNKRKWFFMFIEVWFVSIVILVVSFIIRHGNISSEILVKSVFPTTFSNNWYLTCYLLFYPIHPFLNSIIHKMDKQQLFRTSAALFIIYCCFCFIKGDLFFSSAIVLWIAIYFVVAYFQLHMEAFANSSKHNVIMLLVGGAGYIGIAVVANVLGLHVSYLNGRVLHWATNCNPFLIILSIALFNLIRKLNFKNKVINYISSLSLLIYIIHENLILRTYFRPAMWNYIYQNYGYNKILIWVFALSVLVFIFSLISSAIYDKTFRRLIRKMGDIIYSLVRKIYLKVEILCLNGTNKGSCSRSKE